MECSKCARSNPDDHSYCGFCGHTLQQSSSSTAPHQYEFQTSAINDLKEKLDIIKYEAGESIKDDAINWFKRVLTVYTAVLVIVLLAFGIFGIKEANDLHRSTEKIIKGLTTIENDVNKKTDELIKTFERSMKDTGKDFSDLQRNLLKLELSKDSLQKRFDEINTSLNEFQHEKLKEELTNKFKQIEKLKKEINTGLDTINKVQIKQIKYNNSLFKINIQAHGLGNKESVLNNLDPLLDNGFIIDIDDVLLVNVDKNEVLYYNDIAQRQAQDIVNMLAKTSKFPGIKKIFYDRKERDPREIVIKIKK